MLRLLTLTLALLLLPTAAHAVQATLTWSDDGSAETRIERRDGPDTAPWVAQGALLPAGVKTFQQSGLAPGPATRYCYRVVKTTPAFGDAPGPHPEGCGGNPLNANSLTIIFSP